MKGLEVRSTAFVAELQSAEVAEPAERALDDVACLAKAAAVGTRLSERPLGPATGGMLTSNGNAT